MKCASTALSSKLVAHQKDFFSKMVVDAVTLLDELLPLNMIGIKKVQGGALEVCNVHQSCVSRSTVLELENGLNLQVSRDVSLIKFVPLFKPMAR